MSTGIMLASPSASALCKASASLSSKSMTLSFFEEAFFFGSRLEDAELLAFFSSAPDELAVQHEERRHSLLHVQTPIARLRCRPSRGPNLA